MSISTRSPEISARPSAACSAVAGLLRSAAVLLTAGLAGCTLTPAGADAEQERLRNAGGAYEPRPEDREAPELSASPTWREVLRRAFLANGDLEAAYFEWKAAVQRIEMASAYPNSNIQLGYSYMFSSERMKSFDRQTFSFGFDPAMNLSLPGKVRQKGRVALDEARAAGERFRAAKFDLQRRVLAQWSDLRMLEEKRTLQREQVSLGRLSISALHARGQAGGVQRDLLLAEAALRTQENALASTQAELSAMRAMLNGMLAREPNAPLDAAHDEPRALAASDDRILSAAAELNPEIAALARQAEGRADALELARMRWLPDVNPNFMFTGSVSQALGAMVMLPTAIAEIRGGVREAEAMLRASEAVLRQTRSDRAAALVATLATLRNAERQAEFFEGTLVPLADRVQANANRSYASGSAMYLDVLEARGMALEARLMAVEWRAARDKRLAELEALIGADIETLGESSAGSPSLTTAGKEAHHDR